MEEKKKNGSVVVIILLVIVILVLGGYVVYDKVLSKEAKDTGVVDKKDAEVEEKEETENLEVAGELVVGLVNKITKTLGCTDFKDIYLTDGIFKGEDFSNQDIYSLALRSIYDSVKGDSVTGTGYKDFTADTLDKAIEKIVGSDYKFTHNSYVSCPAWDYDANSKNYKAPASSACGCTTGPYHTIAKTSKAVKIGDKIEIYQRVIFVDTSNGKGYSDSKKTKEITDLTRLGGIYEEAIDESDDENIIKGTLYKLTFEEENGEYVFVSSEPVSE